MIEVKLHDIGEGMTEGEILHYFVKIGDKIVADQPLVEVQTDKMTAEIPAPSAGIVSDILVAPGSTVSVGTTLLLIQSESRKETGKEEKQKPPALHMVQMPGMLDSKNSLSAHHPIKPVLASPYTRKIARENGIDIELVQGTGPAGRITDEDVNNYINSMKQGRREDESIYQKNNAASEYSTESDKKIQKHSKSDIKLQETDGTTSELIPFKGRRKQIANKMVQSLYTIPHVTHFEEIDMTDLIALREQLKEKGLNISAGAFFIKSLQLALKEFPIFNAKLDEENEVIHLLKYYNIGIATDTEDGLIVPVIHHVEQKSLKQIHSEMKELTLKAQNNQLSARDLTGGTFTISNVGPFGSIGATPIINYPEVALVAFHKTKEMPVVRNNQIVIRSIMNISMSFDHRVADGLTALKFTNRFKEYIEHPKLIMMELV